MSVTGGSNRDASAGGASLAHPPKEHVVSMSVEEEIVALCRDLVQMLPPGCASLEVKRAPEIAHDGVSVWIVPARTGSAPISIDVKDGEPNIGLVLGRCTHVELQVKTDSSSLPAVSSICAAVFQGQFEETLWLVGDEIVKCVGKLTVGKRPRRYFYNGRVFFFRRKQKHSVQYVPYWAGGPGKEP